MDRERDDKRINDMKINDCEEIQSYKKSKRKKNPTTCIHKRRNPYNNSCGICGSDNVVGQGVTYCADCGKEKDFWNDNSTYSFYYSGPKPKCKCGREVTFKNGKTVILKNTRSISIAKCIDCGAVKSSFCPNCKKRNGNRDCWKHWDGRMLCGLCGFTISKV